MASPIHIIQLLLLFEEDSVRDLSPALWAALLEVERFYNQDEQRATFERQFVSRHQPPSSLLASTLRTVARFFGREVDNALALLSEQAVHNYSLDSERSIQGRFVRTIDQTKLLSTARGLLDKDRAAAHLMIVTDREITPPKGWRYVIWDGDDKDAVVSIAPTDPKFWRQQDPSRVATIKHRVRAACLSLTGERLGFSRCQNPSCFLYDDVDSVLSLDSMFQFGSEHRVPGLSGLGFGPAGRDPAVLQPPAISSAQGSAK